MHGVRVRGWRDYNKVIAVRQDESFNITKTVCAVIFQEDHTFIGCCPIVHYP